MGSEVLGPCHGGIPNSFQGSRWNFWGGVRWGNSLRDVRNSIMLYARDARVWISDWRDKGRGFRREETRLVLCTTV